MRVAGIPLGVDIPIRDFVAGVSPLDCPPRDAVPRYPLPRRHAGWPLARLLPRSLRRRGGEWADAQHPVSLARHADRPQWRYRAVSYCFVVGFVTNQRGTRHAHPDRSPVDRLYVLSFLRHSRLHERHQTPARPADRGGAAAVVEARREAGFFFVRSRGGYVGARGAAPATGRAGGP